MSMTREDLEARLDGIEAAVTSIGHSVFATTPEAPMLDMDVREPTSEELAAMASMSPEEFGKLPEWLQKKVDAKKEREGGGKKDDDDEDD